MTLLREAQKNNVIVAIELHKRYDAFYADARDRIARLGHLNFFSSYMSRVFFLSSTWLPNSSFKKLKSRNRNFQHFKLGLGRAVTSRTVYLWSHITNSNGGSLNLDITSIHITSILSNGRSKE